MSRKTFQYLRERIAEVRAAPSFIVHRASNAIQEKLRRDSTTKRGNIPCYGRFGDIPTRTEASGNTITVHAADWVLGRAAEEGQIDEWCDIIQSEARKAISRGHR